MAAKAPVPGEALPRTHRFRGHGPLLQNVDAAPVMVVTLQERGKPRECIRSRRPRYNPNGSRPSLNPRKAASSRARVVSRNAFPSLPAPTRKNWLS
jgi:hypothetical protein